MHHFGLHLHHLHRQWYLRVQQHHLLFYKLLLLKVFRRGSNSGQGTLLERPLTQRLIGTLHQTQQWSPPASSRSPLLPLHLPCPEDLEIPSSLIYYLSFSLPSYFPSRSQHCHQWLFPGSS
jgi:hypothetical protein